MKSDQPVYTWMESPAGPIVLARNEAGLLCVRFEKTKEMRPYLTEWIHDPAPLRDAVNQLQAYFAKELREFDLPLAPQGSTFQKRVWDLLCAIPYGETATYGELAKRLGNPNGSRAVGAANGKNPIAIIVPCHRVIGSDGSLTGYAYGVETKKKLLALEGVEIGAKEQAELF